MSAPSSVDPDLSHRQVQVDGLPIHIAEAGTPGKPAVVFLHGWPQSWAAFARVMAALRDEAHVFAVDLPGIGGSPTPPPANDKRTLARYVRGVIAALALTDVTLAGHDAGGQIVYSYLHAYPEELARAVIMNVAIPGLDPWAEVKRSPHIWHFALPRRCRELPESWWRATRRATSTSSTARSPRGRRRSHPRRAPSTPRPTRVPKPCGPASSGTAPSPRTRRTTRPRRASPSTRPSSTCAATTTPATSTDYLQGLRDGGLRDVQGRRIPDCGHFAPDEQPEAVGAALREFVAAGVEPITPWPVVKGAAASGRSHRRLGRGS